MVFIAPFRALRYVDQDMGAVTSPPHDVITPEERDAFIAHDPNNICQVILPPGGDEKYAHARDTLAKWQQEGVMTRDGAPALYQYEIHHPGGVMRGFFARIAIDPEYETIRRHEKTLPKKRSDRLSLLEATSVNTESIWMLYRDERGWVDEILTSNASDPLVRFTDEEGYTHVLYRVDRPEAVQEIQAQFEDRTVVIADGHHRYATQCKRYAETGKEEDASMLVCLVRDTDPGLAIRPTNRLLRRLPFETVEAACRATDWDVEPLTLPEGAAKAVAIRAAITDAQTVVALGPDGAFRLRAPSVADEGRGRLDHLAVTILHDRLLSRHWGVDMEDVESYLHYSRSDEETVAQVEGGDYPCAVFLAGEPVDAVLDVAMAGHVMPQKATYFVPKLRSGLLLSPCDEALPHALDAGLESGPADWRSPF